MRIFSLAGAVLLAAHAAFAAAPKSRLADTWWSADGDCYITDIAFHAEGRAAIFYQDGRDDGADWMLSGSTLVLRFDVYDDSFMARFTGSTIRAVHRWRENARAPWQTEDCVFREALGGGI